MLGVGPRYQHYLFTTFLGNFWHYYHWLVITEAVQEFQILSYFCLSIATFRIPVRSLCKSICKFSSSLASKTFSFCVENLRNSALWCVPWVLRVILALHPKHNKSESFRLQSTSLRINQGLQKLMRTYVRALLSR